VAQNRRRRRRLDDSIVIVDRWRPPQLASDDGSQGRGESHSLRREVPPHYLLIKQGFLDYAKSRGDKRTSRRRRRKESSRAFAPRSRLVDQRSAFDAQTIGMPRPATGLSCRLIERAQSLPHPTERDSLLFKSHSESVSITSEFLEQCSLARV
jgi:hypothetical protein